MGSFNFGDVLYQLINLAFIVLIVILIVSFVRSYKNRGKQLNRMEKKIDELNEQMKRE